MMASEEPAPTMLLALPDPCLVTVLRCCAADSHHSLFNAARAHSRLRQAAVLALRSITAVLPDQQQADSVLLYLRKHGKHIDSIDLKGRPRNNREDLTASIILPSNLQLSSLQLSYLKVQLQPGHGFQGVLGCAGVQTLKKLRLSSCELPNEAAAQGLTAALSELPAGLEHLCIHLRPSSCKAHFPTTALLQLQELTYLELTDIWLRGHGGDSPVLQSLEALTRLVDLRIAADAERVGDGATQPMADEDSDEDFINESGHQLTASMLTGAQELTRLEYCGDAFEPSVLAGRTKLQHLALSWCRMRGGAANVAELLSHLRMLHPTYLSLAGVLNSSRTPTVPEASYSVLTANSKLQHLDISDSKLPTYVWGILFPPGRQLPLLRSLDITSVSDAWMDGEDPAQPPDGNVLVRCCPALQSLNCGDLMYNEYLLGPLKGLSGLRTLNLNMYMLRGLDAGLEALCQLTGLRYLDVTFMRITQQKLLQLTRLQQLTALTLHANQMTDCPVALAVTTEGPDDEPLWQQLPRLLLEPGTGQKVVASVPWPTLTE